MSLKARHLIPGTKDYEEVSAEEAVIKDWKSDNFKCCGCVRKLGKVFYCSADLMLIVPENDPPYFRETRRAGDATHIDGCDQKNTNEVEYSEEYRLKSRLAHTDNLAGLHGILVNDRNNAVAERQNAAQPEGQEEGPHLRRRENPDDERAIDIAPRNLKQYFFCRLEGKYDGDKDDFLFFDNHPAYRSGRKHFEGEKIAITRRFGRPDAELMKQLRRMGNFRINEKNSIWLQDAYSGDRSVIIILFIDQNIKEQRVEMKYSKERSIWVDRKDGEEIVDKNGVPVWHGPYYAVFANWRRYTIQTPQGERQVALGRFVSRKQIEHFKNDDLEGYKEFLAAWSKKARPKAEEK